MACLLIADLSAAGTESSTLSAGQSLYAYGPAFPNGGSDQIASPSGEFVLSVGNGMLAIQQYLVGFGCTPWSTPQVGSSSDTSRLTMQTNGSLVLYTSGGHAIWSSDTVGSGTNNRLVMQDNGNLVIYSAAGKVIWTTGSGRGCLLPGMTISSGARLVSRYQRDNASPTTTFIMEHDGDLVLFYGSKVVWHTKTWVRGSTARFLTNGNLIVYSPARKVLWSSRTGWIGRKARLVVDPCGTVFIYYVNEAGGPWHTPAVPHPGCL
jgi:hypothetical protein